MPNLKFSLSLLSSLTILYFIAVSFQEPTLFAKSSDYIDQIPIVDKRTKKNLTTLKLTSANPLNLELVIFDKQYDKQMSYKALDVLLTLRIAARKINANMANLIFDNGMVIPISLNRNTLKHLYIAHSVRIEQDKPKASSWERQFPEIAKKSERWRDPRPIKFNGNKLVFTDEVNYALAYFPIGNKNESFAPFRHSASLMQIELLEQRTWSKQFAVGSSVEIQHELGQKVFMQRCQYCHGVNGVGASFGWDFAEPLALHEKRNPQSLFQHVKYEKTDALERGLMMPHQANLQAREAQSLWLWMKAITDQKAKSYDELLRQK